MAGPDAGSGLASTNSSSCISLITSMAAATTTLVGRSMASLLSTHLNIMADDRMNQLEDLYILWASLRPESGDEQFIAFGDYFHPFCVAWLSSMRDYANPSRGRKEIVEFVKASLKNYHYESRDIVSRSYSEDYLKISIEGKASMNIMGTLLENVYETVVATFDQTTGLISDLKVYTCRSHLVLVLQSKTGRGPYSEAYLQSPEARSVSFLGQ
ncbi:MAG: hypothetical protein GOMPHAMPRED_002495 [Gomphillus americanus]|uniref:Uncharacterized protein n=1 Tax=Gomphillus americanus TaxID=1940652 RepID=A0A8H3F9X3_9LECA|nr:MAG: hypothetical protein GOMPHAMPRED_002495 [Gomphillus americanus]